MTTTDKTQDRAVRLYVVRHDQWEPLVERVFDPEYEALDDALDAVGLNGHIDVRAGAFYWRKNRTVYIDEAQWRLLVENQSKKVRALCRHEVVCHAWDCQKGKHPTGIKGFGHAMSVGFDDRAFTGALRWFPYKPMQFAADSWVDDRLLDWSEGRLKAMPAPTVAEMGK